MTSLGRKKTESNCLANFPRTISQTSSLLRQSQHKRKISRDKTRSIIKHNCSDLTCTKKYALTRQVTEAGGGGGGSYAQPSSQSLSGCYGKIQYLGMILDMNQLLSHMRIENRAFCRLGDGIKTKKSLRM